MNKLKFLKWIALLPIGIKAAITPASPNIKNNELYIFSLEKDGIKIPVVMKLSDAKILKQWLNFGGDE